jgi:hypothetical protein
MEKFHWKRRPKKFLPVLCVKRFDKFLEIENKLQQLQQVLTSSRLNENIACHSQREWVLLWNNQGNTPTAHSIIFP